jgi:hypothetical protein
MQQVRTLQFLIKLNLIPKKFPGSIIDIIIAIARAPRSDTSLKQRQHLAKIPAKHSNVQGTAREFRHRHHEANERHQQDADEK